MKKTISSWGDVTMQIHHPMWWSSHW